MWGFVDWGSQEHQLCLVDDEGKVVCQRRFPQTAVGLAELCAVLRCPRPGLPAAMGVGIERNDGPVVDAIREASFEVYAINPKQLDRFREFVTSTGRKDDKLDAYVGAEALRSHRDRFKRLITPEPWTILLRDQLRLRADLVQQQVRLQNRIREQLQRYYPQFWELGDLKTAWQRALWPRVSTPAKARRVRPKTIAALLKKHHVRRYDAEGLLQTLSKSPLSVAEGVVEGAQCRLRYYFAELELVHEYLALCTRELELLLQQRDEQERASLAPNEPTDIQLMRALPGFGIVTVSTLHAHAHEALAARDWQQLRTRTGVAPVSRLSGTKQNRYYKRTKAQVRMRYACSEPLRSALFHAARTAMQRSPFYKARYERYRQHGHTHGRACRQIGDHLLRVMVAMLRSRLPFDPSRLDLTKA